MAVQSGPISDQRMFSTRETTEPVIAEHGHRDRDRHERRGHQVVPVVLAAGDQPRRQGQEQRDELGDGVRRERQQEL